MANEQQRTEAELDEQLAATRGAGGAEDEPRATSARYNRETGRVEVELRGGCLFAFPAELAQGLRGASPETLEEVEVTPTGSGLHWESLDADLHVASLVAGVFGPAAWMRALGRAGGSSCSEAKAAASRANGRKGGRPRKSPYPPSTPGRRAVREEQPPYGEEPRGEDAGEPQG
jgi:hypothetical protein